MAPWRFAGPGQRNHEVTGARQNLSRFRRRENFDVPLAMFDLHDRIKGVMVLFQIPLALREKEKCGARDRT